MAAGYFKEYMNGFEYQVAGHMIWVGLLKEGLAITRAVHDRYHASRRNPWNEVECGDHYARSMASYGVYLAACGFGYHGPHGRISFAPRLSPENFKGAFTTAKGWGSFLQAAQAGTLKAAIQLKWGKLTLSSLELALTSDVQPTRIQVRHGRRVVRARLAVEARLVRMTFDQPVVLKAGQVLDVILS